MAKHVGAEWSMTIDSTTIAEVLSIDISEAHDTADSTNADSSGWEEHLRTNRNWSADVEAHWDPTDAGYQAVRDAIQGDNQVSFDITQTDGTNSEDWTGNGSITDFGFSSTHDDTVTFTFTVTATGSVLQA